MKIIPIYASLLAFLFVYLSFRVIRQRFKHQVALGDAGNKEILRAIGVHANFAEYVPLTLLLLTFAELKEMPNAGLHALCVLFTLGRFSHAYGVSQMKENLKFRQAGMVATFSTIIITSIYLLYRAF